MARSHYVRFDEQNLPLLTDDPEFEHILDVFDKFRDVPQQASIRLVKHAERA